VRRYLASGAAVGPYLADQLLLPLALAGAGAFTASALSRHTLTNAEVIRRFLGIGIRMDKTGDDTYRIEIGSRLGQD
jgi:RNA 3'-terminal phosphate cyclase (ATP)